MKLSINKEKLSDLNAKLLILFAFFLPLSVAITNLIMAFIIIIWISIFDFKNDWNKVKDNNLVKIVLIFVLLHVVALFWTEDLQWGALMLKKELKFLLLPIFMLFIKKEYIKYYILAFLSAITVSEISSYLIWFEIIEPFKSASVTNPTPFMSHISYNPFLVIALYIIIYLILFEKNISNSKKYFYLFFVVTMSINMFITGGRAGQVMYFVMILILFFQYYSKNIFKAIFLSSLTILMIFSLAYNMSNLFSERVDLAYTELIDYQNKKDTSTGLRITYALNSLEIIKENLIFGIGTGDFKNEYEKMNQKNTPELMTTVNPHNMYILILVQFGLVGLLIFLSIFYVQIKKALNNKNDLMKKMGIALPLLFLVIMFSDTYLLGHFTTMLFVFFSSIIYKDYDDETI